MPRVAAIVQARMGSTRLPGKVLLDLGGKPAIERVVERVGRIDGLTDIVVATTQEAQDDALVEVVERIGGVDVVRGATDDVLGRYCEAARHVDAEVVVRLTGDCPLLCPSVSARVLAAFLAAPCDYASNTLARRFPRGLDTEVIARGALERAAAEARRPDEREHVTPYVWRRPEAFRLRSVTDTADHSDLRLTLDTPEDYALLSRVYADLGGRPAFDYPDLLACLARHPDWRALNDHIEQKPV
ncbi:cytidylyltransferase domain-containing protein [Rubrivirga sp. IMCC43871]|uniref:cytidylyltransferase domain-containing protein n=1 Tax=Rubrivirga sp. IMCC43871 TaxID=3391575 RepID=UPI00398FF729